MESKQINACTFVNDNQIAFVRVSLFSFIQTNRWFDGKLFLLVHPDFPLSDFNFKRLKLIYQNVERVDIPKDSFSTHVKQNTSNYINTIGEYCKLYAFSLVNTDNLLYFSNSCLFTKEITSLLQTDQIVVTPEKSLIYISLKNSIFEEYLVSRDSIDSFLNYQSSLKKWITLDNISISAFSIKDNKFSQLIGKVKAFACIFYENSIISGSLHTHQKIKQVWLHKNSEVNNWLSSPSNVTTTHLQKSNDPVTSKKPNLARTHANTKLIELPELKNYLNNKKIAIVANSAELLNYEYGKLIDSHDVVIRFNGYKISMLHTGKKTNIHCIFREARFNLNSPSDYLIVFSKPLHPWRAAINEILKTHPFKKIINYNFPSSRIISNSLKTSKIPTSGLCSIFLIEELGIARYQLTLFGFNGYANGIHSISRSNNSIDIAAAHNYEEEISYIEESFNKEAPEIFKKK